MNPQEQNTSNDIFSEKLQEAINAKGWTQKELEGASGINQGSISNYLRGARQPTATQLFRLSWALGVSMEWLMTGRESDWQDVDLWKRWMVMVATTRASAELEAPNESHVPLEEFLRSVESDMKNADHLATRERKQAFLEAFQAADRQTQIFMMGWAGDPKPLDRTLELFVEVIKRQLNQ